MLVKTTGQARDLKDRQVWWDDISARWNFLRSGYVNDAHNGQVEIDHDWKVIKNLTNLRTTKELNPVTE